MALNAFLYKSEEQAFFFVEAQIFLVLASLIFILMFLAFGAKMVVF